MPQWKPEAVNGRLDNTMPWPKEKGQKDKQRLYKTLHNNCRLSNTSPTENLGWTQALRKDSACGTRRETLITKKVV